MKAFRTLSLPAPVLRWWPLSRRFQIVLAVAIAVILGLRAQWYLVDQVDLWTGLIFWAFAGAFFLYALWQARGALVDGGMSEEAADGPGKAVLPLTAEIVLFAVVIGVGIFFRFYRIGDIPPGLNHDAAWNGLYAIRITQGIGYSAFVNCCGAVGHETMFHYVIAAFQLIVGPTAFAIQLAAVSIGIATLAVFYLLIRRMFDARVALVATLLLGVSGWHITFSRAGWHAILIPLFEALTFYLLLRALDTRRIRDFVLAGVAVGLSLDTYDAAKTIPLSVAVFLLYLLFRNRSLIRTYSWQFVTYGVAALAAFAPLGWYILNNWDGYTGRSRMVWIGDQIERAGSWEPLWRNLGDGLLIFNFRGHGDDFFVTEPLLDVPVSIFFVLGLGYSLTRIKRPEHFLLLTMLVLSLVNGFLSEPNGNRALGAVLPVSAYAALFLVVAWRWLQQAFPHVARWSWPRHAFPDVGRWGWLRQAFAGPSPYFGVGLVAVLVVAAYATFDDYLGPDRRTQWGFYPETTRVGRYVKTIADDYEVHLVAGNWPRDALTYLSYSGEGDPFQWRYTYTSEAEEVLATGPSAERGAAFVIEDVPRYEDAFNFLRSAYPTATEDRVYYPDDSDSVVANVLLVPAGATAAAEVPPVATPPAETGPAPPGAAERDAERRSELLLLAAALVEYKEENGSYPSTGNNVQTACAYEDLDVLCQLRPEVGAEALVDPFGDPHEYGYWYASDGESFTLYALLEETPAPEETCTAPGDLGSRENLYCLHATE